jgi:hypothetical protein
MWYTIAYKIACQLYPMFRPIIVKNVENPNHEWDDQILKAVDVVLNYQGK